MTRSGFRIFRALFLAFFPGVLAVAPASAQLRHGVGSWEPDSLGNHRAVVRVNAPAPAVLAHIEWRRRDTIPDRVATIVIAAWERELDREKLKVALSGHELRTDERPATPAC